MNSGMVLKCRLHCQVCLVPLFWLVLQPNAENLARCLKICGPLSQNSGPLSQKFWLPVSKILASCIKYSGRMVNICAMYGTAEQQWLPLLL